MKPFFYYGADGEKIKTIQSTTYLILAGKIGLGIGAMSFCDTLKVTVTSDDNVFKEEDVNRLTALIEQNLIDEIKRNGITMETYNALEAKKDK